MTSDTNYPKWVTTDATKAAYREGYLSSQNDFFGQLDRDDRHFLQLALIALCSEYEDEDCGFLMAGTFAKAKRVSVKLGLQTDLLDKMGEAYAKSNSLSV